MKSLVPVEARRLHSRPVRLRDATTLVEASLFPFFDSEGTVRSLMLVWPAAPSVLMLEMKPRLVRVPWFGPVEIDADFAEQRDADATRARAMASGLWHHDPWWVLQAPRYRGHPAVPVLEVTNCVDLFPQRVAGCFFASDLSRVMGFSRKGISGVKIDAALMDSLSARVPKVPTPALRPSRAGWRLDPFWQRETWRRRMSHDRGREWAR